MRRYLAISFLAVAVVMAGCTPAPATDTSSPSPAPATPTQTPTPTAQPTATAAPTPTPTVETFTNDQLVTLCADQVRPVFDVDVQFDSEGARVERRNVDPPWLVLIPAQTLGYQAQAQCTIGGTPQSPVFELANGSLHPYSEQDVQDLIEGVYDFGGN